MKKLKIIYKALILLLIINACSEEDRSLDFLDNVAPPSNVAASYNLSQDNSGLVTILPTAVGATMFDVYFGDASAEEKGVEAGKMAQYTYAEGTYNVKVIAYNSKGDTAEAIQELVVSFKAPENLEVTIENDIAISKQLNITAKADFAATYDFYSGEADVAQPAASANIGDVINYQYATAGTYNVKVIAKGGAIETTEYTGEFEVTAILAPLKSANTQPARDAADVISIFSDTYTDVAGTDFNPNWSQTTVYTPFELNGDAMIQYSNLNYQGIQIGETQDISGMEFLHLDVWTADATELDTYLISVASGEKMIKRALTKDAWTTINIPISAFTEQGLSVDDIHQFKFEGSGSVFIDNLYFYKASSAPVTGVTPLTFETDYELSSFDGGSASVIANPDANGNSSSSVLELVKNAGQLWAGSKITISSTFDVSNTTITAKVWSPRVGLDLLLKFEDATPWPNTVSSAEITATTTVANAWEELTFDFSGISTSVDFNNLVLIMDNGTEGDGSSDFTIYVDDISTSPVLDFEPEFILSSFDGGAISVIANPDTNGNASAMVAQIVKNAGQLWAGSKITVPTPFSFTNGTSVKVKVWSPRAGLDVLLKFEDATPWPNTVASAEITATTTTANAWEELTFDFSGISTTVDFTNLVLIMDNGTEGDGSANYTIYLDDISQF
ncbi:PKD domain protein [Polaribacter sp. 11A2H]|uniref:PKD domain protein n=1 Tax=Polaribacter sp. 11A2H TaxID=2687290 RepID=UPI00140A1821|nr:PKD domain protein [Polaribacter sp. 11A2H]